jgi:cardiolipin synthase
LSAPGDFGRAVAAEDDRRAELEYVLPWLVRRPHNRVTSLRDGREAYPAMLDAIAGARRSVHLETYTLSDDRTGRVFLEALLARRAAGVEVRVLYDAVGSFELPSAFVEELVAGGIETAEFNPVAPWRARFALNRRDHQKCLVVDDTVGFVGGLNVSDEYSPLEDGGQGWRDQAVRIEGPVVHDLSVNFRRTWLLARGRAFRPPLAAPAGDPAQGFAAEVALVTNYVRRRLGLSGRAMNRSALHAIRKAERQVSIMSAYFSPGAAMRRALYRAVARGVDVRIVVPEVSDVRAAWYAGRHLYGQLLRRGVTLLEWPETMMHAKLAIIDGTWTTVGSYNIDQRSLLHNLEAAVIVLDRGFGARMQEAFDEDVSRCRALTVEAWRRRPWLHRPLETVCHGLRYWL